jgi:hypothetical protein
MLSVQSMGCAWDCQRTAGHAGSCRDGLICCHNVMAGLEPVILFAARRTTGGCGTERMAGSSPAMTVRGKHVATMTVKG